MGEIRPKAVWLFGIFDGYFRQALALKLSRAGEGDAEAESLKEQLQYRSPAAAGGGGLRQSHEKVRFNSILIRFNPI